MSTERSFVPACAESALPPSVEAGSLAALDQGEGGGVMGKEASSPFSLFQYLAPLNLLSCPFCSVEVCKS